MTDNGPKDDLLPLPSTTTLVDIDIDLDFGRLDVLALLDTTISSWSSSEWLVRGLLLKLLIISSLPEFVDTSVVNLETSAFCIELEVKDTLTLYFQDW